MNLIVGPGVARWVPPRRELGAIAEFFGPRLSPAARVEILPRSAADTELGRVLPPYTYRAFTRGDVSKVFVDDTETPQSVAFVVAHELCHQLVDRSPTLVSAFSDSKVVGVQPWTDRFHRVDAEERFCDGIAARVLGTWFDREWWRRRTPPASYSGLVQSPRRRPWRR